LTSAPLVDREVDAALDVLGAAEDAYSDIKPDGPELPPISAEEQQEINAFGAVMAEPTASGRGIARAATLIHRGARIGADGVRRGRPSWEGLSPLRAGPLRVGGARWRDRIR
jgi:hypothetical protein